MKQHTPVEWLEDRYRPKGYLTAEEFSQAKEMEKQQIMLAIAKHLPIEDGVITAVQKAEQYYNEEYGDNNEQQ